MEIYNDNFLTLTFPSGEFYPFSTLTAYGYKVEKKKLSKVICIFVFA